MLLVVLGNTIQIASLLPVFESKLVEAKELARPAEVGITLLTTGTCTNCFNISPVENLIANSGINVTSRTAVDISSEQAKELIALYEIERIPTLILTGEINKTSILKGELKEMGEVRSDAFVYTSIPPPYYSPQDQKIVGMVSLYIVDPVACDICPDLSSLVDSLEQAGVVFQGRTYVLADSDEGRSLISRYSLERLPALIMDSEILSYSALQSGLAKVGSYGSDGTYVMQPMSAPYFDLNKRKEQGLVSVTFLTDGSCQDCYDPALFHKPILQNLGVVITKESTVDSSSVAGKQMISAYNISLVPALLLKGDADAYPSLVGAWKSVGTVESDGTFVFRRVDLAKKAYKNIVTGDVIKP